MRRLATISSALGFLWACAATAYLLVVASPAGVARSTTLAAGAGDAAGLLPPLATAEGVWLAGLLMGVALLAGVPFGVALAHPTGLRPTGLTTGFAMVGFCALSGDFVGLLYLPCALLLIAAGAVARAEPRAAPYADLRA